MPQATLFVEVQGGTGIIEVVVQEDISESALHEALALAGVPGIPELLVFIDESEEPISHGHDRPAAGGVKHGARVHVTRCRHIQTAVRFLERTIERAFPPGARVRSVKKWATREFEIDNKDAAEHILQICNTKDRPATDTPLHALIQGPGCSVCFDLVPEKRVEG
jgi:hypothetical protein